jgi:hypothetical protein
MKRTALTLTIIVVLLFSAVAGIQLVNLAKANWIPITPKVPAPLPPKITINSPETKIYQKKELSLSFTVKVSLLQDVEFRAWNETTQTMTYRTLRAPQDRTGIPFISYTLDGAETILKNVNSSSVGETSWEYSTLLTSLSEGVHTLTINASGRQSAANLVTIGISPDKDPIFTSRGTYYSKDVWSIYEITFIVDASSPNVSILSPKNNTYQKTDLSLNFTINESVSWISYSLDRQANVTIIGNTTLSELAYDSHSLTIYAQDSARHIVASETIWFNIADPFPTPQFLASVIINAVAGLGFFTYLKKRRS